MDSNIDKNNKHIFYFDALRALAILCVITIHVFMITKNNLFFSRYSIHSIHFILLQLMGNPFGVGVDIFLMLSGALLLGRKWNIKDFLSKDNTNYIPLFLLECTFYSINHNTVF